MLNLNKMKNQVLTIQQEVQEIIKSKFNNTELGLGINKEDFKEYFLELLNSYKSIKFLDKNGDVSKLPTKCYQLCDESGLWLFDINLNPNEMYFLYSYNRTYKKLLSKFGGNYVDYNYLIRGILDETTELKDITPTIF